MYVFGGIGGPGLLDTIEKYVVSHNQWTALAANLTTPRQLLKCRLLSIDNNIYCMGGQNYVNGPLDVVDVFDPDIEEVVNIIYLNNARSDFTATLWSNNACIIISGGNDNSTVLNSIETFGDCTGSNAFLYL